MSTASDIGADVAANLYGGVCQERERKMEFKFLNSDSLKWEAIIHIVKMFNVDYTWSEHYCSLNIKTENIFIVHTLNSVYNRFVVQDEPIVI